ncbi:hypothetical protein GCM10027167_40950 [Nocardia heshunensis]
MNSAERNLFASAFAALVLLGRMVDGETSADAEDGLPVDIQSTLTRLELALIDLRGRLAAGPDDIEAEFHLNNRNCRALDSFPVSPAVIRSLRVGGSGRHPRRRRDTRRPPHGRPISAPPRP